MSFFFYLRNIRCIQFTCKVHCKAEFSACGPLYVGCRAIGWHVFRCESEQRGQLDEIVSQVLTRCTMRKETDLLHMGACPLRPVGL